MQMSQSSWGEEVLMSDSEEKNPKGNWLEKLSEERGPDENFQDTWTRTVFVKNKGAAEQQIQQASGQDTMKPDTVAPSGGLPDDPLPDASPDVLVGQVIAEKYLITDFIGKGGMSSIYKVNHMQLDTVLALKLLDKNMWADPTAVKRFKLEAQTVSRLTHPNLITYRDFGVTADGQPYLVMDYIQGKTLGHKIKETRGIFLPTVLEIFEQLCEGLSVAHGLGIVHRDVKPGNIMFLTEDSIDVKLVDFGIAKIVAEENNESQQLTKTGDVFGSPLYMSPEQCMGRKLDNRSDIYALGCVIYESMTGRHAVSGNTILDTMNKHVSLMPSLPSEIRPDLGSAQQASWVNLDDFEYVVMKCLQKNPNDRYKTVDDVLVDLKKVKNQISLDKDLPTTSVKSLRRSTEFERTSPKEIFQMVATAAYVLAGIGVVGAIVAIFVLTNKSTPAPPPRPASEQRSSGPSQSIVLQNVEEQLDSSELDVKARRYMMENKWEDAADMLQASINMYKRQGKADLMLAPRYVDLGNCYLNTNQYQESLTAFKDAMAIYKKQPPDLLVPQRKESLLGQARALRKMTFDKAAAELEEEAKSL